MSFADTTLRGFLDLLASGSPTPGGGGGAAIGGALGAALASMVCNLTVGRAKYAAVEPEMRAILARSEALRQELTALADEDARAYNAVLAAYRLPRDDDAARAARGAAIEQAMQGACIVPERIVAACHEVIDLCEPLAERANPNALGDVATAAQLALGGLRGAAAQAEINLASLKDAAFARATAERLAAHVQGRQEQVDAIIAVVMRRATGGG